jgi:putative endonuclease
MCGITDCGDVAYLLAPQTRLYLQEVQMKNPAIYILASKFDGVLYVGVTSNLINRVWQYKSRAKESFSKRYFVHRLVYYEHHATMIEAIRREKQLKHGTRAYKKELIESINPYWKDLYPSLIGMDEVY